MFEYTVYHIPLGIFGVCVYIYNLNISHGFGTWNFGRHPRQVLLSHDFPKIRMTIWGVYPINTQVDGCSTLWEGKGALGVLAAKWTTSSTSRVFSKGLHRCQHLQNREDIPFSIHLCSHVHPTFAKPWGTLWETNMIMENHHFLWVNKV